LGREGIGAGDEFERRVTLQSARQDAFLRVTTNDAVTLQSARHDAFPRVTTSNVIPKDLLA